MASSNYNIRALNHLRTSKGCINEEHVANTCLATPIIII